MWHSLELVACLQLAKASVPSYGSSWRRNDGRVWKHPFSPLQLQPVRERVRAPLSLLESLAAANGVTQHLSRTLSRGCIREGLEEHLEGLLANEVIHFCSCHYGVDRVWLIWMWPHAVVQESCQAHTSCTSRGLSIRWTCRVGNSLNIVVEL